MHTTKEFIPKGPNVNSAQVSHRKPLGCEAIEGLLTDIEERFYPYGMMETKCFSIVHCGKLETQGRINLKLRKTRQRSNLLYTRKIKRRVKHGNFSEHRDILVIDRSLFL